MCVVLDVEGILDDIRFDRGRFMTDSRAGFVQQARIDCISYKNMREHESSKHSP
jgi:hypothetical protein